MYRSDIKDTYLSWIFFIIPLLLISLLTTTVSAAEKQVSRISGDNRYDTSVEISKKSWPRADTVIISVGHQFPDALSGAPLAYSLKAPILLSDSNSLPVVVEREIKRLGATKAIVLGGEKVISNKVVNKLISLNLSVERLNGRDRYETSVEIANKMNNAADTAIIAFGGNFPDSLAIAAYAARMGYPILLTDRTNLPQNVKEVTKKFKQTIVVGGEQVVSSSVLKQLPNPRRIAGEDRYTTASKIIESFYGGVQEVSYVSNGTSFADALTGSVLAAKDNRPIMLIKNNEIPDVVNHTIKSKSISQFIIIGGKSVITEAAEKMLKFDMEALISTAKSLEGTPYVWGGTSPRGFDCSGYLNYVYQKHGIDLPRTTADIWQSSTKVANPSVGDIVFFETYKPGPSHAGIYIGGNEFIHASSSKGVTITRMDNSYFKPRYLGVKKVY